MSKRLTAQTALFKLEICGSCDPDGRYQHYIHAALHVML
mgnify:CR=1 FL=1